MYQIERKDGRVIVRKGESAKFNASEDSYLIFRGDDGSQQVSKVKDLTDVQLLLALANAIELEARS